MTDEPKELTLEESLELLLRQLPPAVRQVFIGDTIPQVVQVLMRKYGMHVDQGAVLEREIIQLLLGVKDPDEFASSLSEEARFTTDTVNAIANDVNDLIFVPIRKKEMQQTKTSEPLRVAQARPAAQAPNYAPPAPPVPPQAVSVPPPLVNRATPESVAPMAPQSAPLESREGATMDAARPLRHLNLLEHEDRNDVEAAPAPMLASAVPVARGGVPAPLPPKAALPRQTAPVQPGLSPRPVVVRPPVPPPPHLPGAPEPEPPAQGNYPADPYREPIE